MDRSVEIVWHFEQVFEPYCMMLKELKQLAITVCLQRKDKH